MRLFGNCFHTTVWRTLLYAKVLTLTPDFLSSVNSQLPRVAEKNFQNERKKKVFEGGGRRVLSLEFSHFALRSWTSSSSAWDCNMMHRFVSVASELSCGKHFIFEIQECWKTSKTDFSVSLVFLQYILWKRLLDFGIFQYFSRFFNPSSGNIL